MAAATIPQTDQAKIASHYSSSRRRQRVSSLLEDCRSWRIELDGELRDVTAFYAGNVQRKLIILVDGEFYCACIRKRETDPYGRCIVDGHSLEIFASSADCFTGRTSMELKVDGYFETNLLPLNQQDETTAKAWSRLIPTAPSTNAASMLF